MSTHATHLRITHINVTAGHIFAEYDEPLSDADRITDDDGNVIMSELYRAGVVEYGRCTGKVHIDPDGEHVGYVYERIERYEDTGERYKRETWIALVAKTTEYVTA